MTVRTNNPRQVFLSHGPRSDIRAEFVALTNAGFQLSSPEMLISWKEPEAAITDAIEAADVLVVLASSLDGSRHRRVASGAGVPVIQVDNADGELGARELVAAASAAVGPAPRSSAGALVPAIDGRSTALALRQLGVTELDADASRFLAGLFEAAGATVRMEPAPVGTPPTSRPDLALWLEDLNAAFGLPLPVEVLWGRRTNLEAIVGRLRYTLAATGARTLVAVHRTTTGPVLLDGGSGERAILLVAAADLISGMGTDSLPGALCAMRGLASPGWQR